MIKLIIFDLDGVLISTKKWHFDALNLALEDIDNKYVISYEDHIKTFDGLPTYDKLKILSETRGLPNQNYKKIFDNKQQYTFQLIKDEVILNNKLIDLFFKLKKNNYRIYIASNAIRETIKLILLKLGIMEYVDNFISNEDVKYAKPSPEMYLQCMIKENISPKHTLIIEDSPKGIGAAIDSGANVLIVKNPDELTYDKIMDKINNTISMRQNVKIPMEHLNVLIPMAGAGSRFEKAGFSFPKPLISVGNKTMIQTAVDCLGINANYIYIVRKEHYEKYNLETLLNLITPNCKIIQVDSLTEGAACTTLLAKEYIDNDDSLLIANSDQYLEWNPMNFFYKMSESKADGGILTFHSTEIKWSFAKLDEKGNVIEVAEKKPISDIATIGIYWYNKGSEYVKYAEQMISKNIRVNNEFYVCPIYNEYILDNKIIKIFNIETFAGLGTPEDLQYFLNNFKK